MEEFRVLLQTCATLKKGEDLFPQMDKIYAKVLACFDVAIEQLGGALNAVVGDHAPSDPVASGASDMQDTSAPPEPLRRIQPDRLAKRAREEDQTPEPRSKRKRVGQLLPKSAIVKSGKIAPPSSTRIRVAREGLRRSEWIRDLRKRSNLPTVVGMKKSKASKGN